MTIGSDSFGNGSAKTEDRFGAPAGNYRSGNRRDSGTAIDDGAAKRAGDELGPRNGAASIDRLSSALDSASPIASSLTAPKLVEPSLPELGLGGSVFSSDSWLESGGGSLADHPLLRGLLLELPPKGTMPQQDWLDRWFEAARSILELLYSQEAGSRP
jgi:hypothetical protein